MKKKITMPIWLLVAWVVSPLYTRLLQREGSGQKLTMVKIHDVTVTLFNRDVLDDLPRPPRPDLHPLLVSDRILRVMTNTRAIFD